MKYLIFLPLSLILACTQPATIQPSPQPVQDTTIRTVEIGCYPIVPYNFTYPIGNAHSNYWYEIDYNDSSNIIQKNHVELSFYSISYANPDGLPLPMYFTVTARKGFKINVSCFNSQNYVQVVNYKVELVIGTKVIATTTGMPANISCILP